MRNNLSRRGFLQTLGVGTVGMALAACTQVAQAPTGEQAPAAAKTTTYVFDYDPTGTDAWVAADAEFIDYFTEKYPDIEVIRDQSPWTGFTEKLLTSIAGGSHYDVLYGYWEWLPLFRDNNVVGALDDLIAADGELSADDFYDYATETVDGEIYGLAWFISGWLHWYNKNAVAEAGHPDLKELELEGKWDYDAWYSFAQALTGEKDGAPLYGYDMNNIRSVTVYIMLAWAFGTEYWNDDFTENIINSEENVNLWKWVQQFYSEGLTPTPGAGAQDQAPGFTNGRAMATMAGQWYTRNIVQENTTELFDVGMVRFPKGPSGQYSVAALNSFYFAREPQEPQAAWTWYKERSFSEEATKIYAQIGGGRFPSRKSVSPQTVYEWEDTEVYESVRPILRTYRTSPKESEWTALYQAAYDEMILATRPIEEILGQLAEDATLLVQG
ncbi:substrate-binding domain-containing protein [Chloroflexi bacterium TSY]|nr:substrate-binding domain-containing protein [Chloroflexi bacterium TSY]